MAKEEKKIRVPKMEVVAEALNQLEEEGSLTPQKVVQEARSPKSVLHNYFDWDDADAADKYRLWQARHLINSVKVEFMGKETQAYYNASVEIEDEAPSRAYFSIQRVLNDDELYSKVLQQSVRELKHFQVKYKEVTELREVIDSEALAKVERKAKRK